jgi:hypothetical protein
MVGNERKSKKIPMIFGGIQILPTSPFSPIFTIFVQLITLISLE